MVCIDIKENFNLLTSHTTSDVPKASTDKPRLSKTTIELIFPLACLLLIEIIAFGVNAKHIGVYMDEWITFDQLHSAQHNLLQLIATFNSDPRKILRPLECLNMPVLFYFVGTKPFWYHVASFSCEFLTACFLYLAVTRLVSNRSVALAAAILFLLDPVHDATHFSIVMWDGNAALWLFTLSLFLYLKGLDEGRTALIYGSSAALLASLCEYEFALPLIIVYPMMWLLAPSFRRIKQKPDLKKFLQHQIPFALAVGIFLVFRLRLACHDKNAYPTDLSLPHFVSIIFKGVSVNFSLGTIAYCSTLLSESISSCSSITRWLMLVAASSCIFWSFKKADSATTSVSQCWFLSALGATVLVASYAIFAISAIHTPNVSGWTDRINAGGALGASLVISGLIGVLLNFIGSRNEQFTRIFNASFYALLAAVLILINWQCAAPWIASWQAQRQLIAAIDEHGAMVKSGDSVIVGDINRYAEAVVVVDQPIELENLLRSALNCKDVYGTVVSERLEMTDTALVDRIGACILGKYPFDQMVLFSPKKSQWIRVSSREQFMVAANKLGWKIPQLREPGMKSQVDSYPVRSEVGRYSLTHAGTSQGFRE